MLRYRLTMNTDHRLEERRTVRYRLLEQILLLLLLLVMVMMMKRLLVMLQTAVGAAHRPRPRHRHRRAGAAGVRRHPGRMKGVRTGGLADGRKISRRADPRRRRMSLEVRPVCQMSRWVTCTIPTPQLLLACKFFDTNVAHSFVNTAKAAASPQMPIY